MGDAVRLFDRLLDGHRTAGDALGAALTAGLDPTVVVSAWARLSASGALREGSDVADFADSQWRRYAEQARTLAMLAYVDVDDTASSWQRAGGEHQRRLATATVQVSGAGSAWRRVVDDLTTAGIGQVVAEGGPAIPDGCDLVVHVDDDPDPGQRLQVNRMAVHSSVPAVFSHRDRGDVVIGPFVYPGETACLECLEVRRTAARDRWEPPTDASAPTPLLSFPIGTDLLVLDVVKFVSRAALPATRGRVVRLDLRVGIPDVHPVLRVPRCPICGPRPEPVRALWAGAESLR